MKNKIRITTLISITIFSLAVLMAVFPFVFTKYDCLQVDPINRLKPISIEHICGTDEFGRDICSSRNPKCENCPLADICKKNM